MEIRQTPCRELASLLRGQLRHMLLLIHMLQSGHLITDQVISLDEFVAFIFSNQAHVLDPNKQLCPIGPLHRATSTLVHCVFSTGRAPVLNTQWCGNGKIKLFYLWHTARHGSGSVSRSLKWSVSSHVVPTAPLASWHTINSFIKQWTALYSWELE